MTAHRFDLFAIGDASVDTYVKVPFIAGPDQKAIGQWIGVYGGGMAANFAAAASNVGARTAFMTVRGDDQAGERLVEELADHEVDTSWVQTLPGSLTFQCFVQLDSQGEKALFGAAPGKKVPDPDDVPEQLLKSSRYVYALADDMDWATIIGERARAAGAAFVIDLERSAIGTDLDKALALVRDADIVFTNTQAFTDVGITDAASILRLLEANQVPLAVVTEGARGSSARDRHLTARVRGIGIDVKDTTGAGDAHNGAFLGRIALGDPTPAALVTATALGALCASHMGPRGYRNAMTRELPTLIEQARTRLETSSPQP